MFGHCLKEDSEQLSDEQLDSRCMNDVKVWPPGTEPACVDQVWGFGEGVCGGPGVGFGRGCVWTRCGVLARGGEGTRPGTMFIVKSVMRHD